jgi:type III secretory pathway component EscV
MFNSSYLFFDRGSKAEVKIRKEQEINVFTISVKNHVNGEYVGITEIKFVCEDVESFQQLLDEVEHKIYIAKYEKDV